MHSLSLAAHRLVAPLPLMALAALVLLSPAGWNGAGRLAVPAASWSPDMASGTTSPPPAAVILPEPDAWGLMIAGMFLSGYELRRRRRVRS